MLVRCNSKKVGSGQLCVKRPRIQGRSKGERDFFRNKESQRFGVSDSCETKESQAIQACDDVAGLGGFEPPRCQSQSLVPYHLATAQYSICIWGERWDSNPRPPGPQPGALTN